MKNNLAAVEVLKNADELWMLENEFLKAVGEEAIKPENRRRLETAVEEEKIIFFAARLNGKVIGICSVSPLFLGVYIRPWSPLQHPLRCFLHQTILHM